MKKLKLILLPLLALTLAGCANGEKHNPTPQAKTYFVSFNVNGGSYVETQRVKEGELAVKPEENPEKGGYTFQCCCSDEALTVEYDFAKPVFEDKTIYAKWGDLQVFDVIFNANGGYFDVEGKPDHKYFYNVPYGTTPVMDLVPIREQDEFKTYVFSGWDKPIVAATEANREYKAVWTELTRYYTVTFDAGDGVFVGEEDPAKTLSFEFTYCGDLTYVPVPSKDGYKFIGWDKEVATVVSEDVTYTAQYELETGHLCKITWVNYDGSVLEIDEVEIGVVPTYDGETPEKPSDDSFDYVFDGWTSEVEEADDDRIYVANFVAVPKGE